MVHKYISIHGLSIHYVEAGTSSHTLILIHGWPFSWKIFEAAMTKLSHHFHVIALDLPGFGHSEELTTKHNLKNYLKILHAFIVELGLKKYSLFGVSYGAAIAIKHTVNYPKEVTHLIINSPFFCSEEVADNRMKFYSAILNAFPKLGVLLAIYNKVTIDKENYLKNHEFFTKYIPEEKIIEMYKEFCLYSNQAAIDVFQDITTLDIRKDLTLLKQPVLVIVGENDVVTPLDMIVKMIDPIPNKQLMVVDEADHAMICEHPSEIASSAYKFIQRPKTGLKKNEFPTLFVSI